LNGRSPSTDDEWANRPVLVTGAGGFLGKWLVRELAARGSAVYALHRRGTPDGGKEAPAATGHNVRIVHGSVTDLAQLSQLVADSKIEVIHHLAASNVNKGAGISPYDVYEINTRGVYTVLEAARLSPRPVRVVVASSREVEDCFAADNPRKFHPYMTSKASAELMTRAYADTYGLAATVLRPENLYGGGDVNWNRLIPNTIQAILRGETPIIRGDGQIRRDYLYVEDAVAAFLALGSRLSDPALKGKIFRIAAGSPASVLDVVNELMRIAGLKEANPTVLGQKCDSRVDLPYQSEFERATLGWQSRFSLAEGLQRTWDWYRDHSAIL
jgi:CDP-glucose 4,6-dehydratase